MSVFVPSGLDAEAIALGWAFYPRSPDIAYAIGAPALRAWMAGHLDELSMRRVREAAVLLDELARRFPEAEP